MKNCKKNVLNPFDQAFHKLQSLGQEHLLKNWDHLSEKQRVEFLRDIERIDVDFFESAKNLLLDETQEKPIYQSYTEHFSIGNPQWEAEGKILLKEGKCGLLVLAGGSGSRLNFKGPKGCFPISVLSKKSLFQSICEKVFTLSKMLNYPLQMAIMTSPTNHKETVQFFKKKAYFGLQDSQVHFFSQKMYPLLTLEKNLFLETPSQIAYGPNGNGDAFKEFFLSPIFAQFQNAGIEYLNVIPVDNPLADPFDINLLGFQECTSSDVSLKAVLRKHPQEKVGVIVQGGKVVEYHEVRLQNEADALAFTGLFSIRLQTIENLQNVNLPLHAVKKRVSKWENGKTDLDFAWKFERFLFENFPYVSHLNVLLFPRNLCFAPLKNFEGDDSIAEVQSKLQAKDRYMYYEVSGKLMPENLCFELSSAFYYPTDDLKKRWQGKILPNNSYIEDL